MLRVPPESSRFNERATRYSYNLYAFVPHERMSTEDQERQAEYVEDLFSLVGNDRNIERAHSMLSNIGWSLKLLRDAGGKGEATLPDILLTQADTGTAMMLVREFHANPSQRTPLEGKSPVDYFIERFGEGNIRSQYMKFLADEYEKRRGYFTQFLSTDQ